MSSQPIYIGFWTDHLKGGLMNSFLTVEHDAGLFLISFLTLFVRLVGSHLWTIITFIIHQINSSPEAQDGLHHQHQFILRNSQSNTSTIWDLIKVAWFWKSKTSRSFVRTFPLLSLAILHVCLFTAAAFYSSRIATISTVAMIAANAGCGYLPFINSASTPAETRTNLEWQIAGKSAANWALEYTRECYYTNSTSSLCESFLRREIPVTSKAVDCPFDPKICLDEGFEVDTGYINSADHLGINSNPEDSIDYRRVTTCAPISSASGVYTWLNDSVDATVEGDFEYFINYGYRYNVNNYSTFIYNYYDLLSKRRAYTLTWQYSEAGNDLNSWFIPIPELNRTDGDVTLIQLFNFARYLEPVTDIFYNATNPSQLGVYLEEGAQRYEAKTPYVSVMGCVTQHQVCTGSPKVCPELSGIDPMTYTVTDNTVQQAIFDHMLRAIHYTGLVYMFSNIGTDSLQAMNGLIGDQRLEHIGLPDKFWHTEVQGWAQHAVVNMQRLLHTFVSGYDDTIDVATLEKPDPASAGVFDVCANQKTRYEDTYSFNVFGLFFTLVAGLVVVLINLCLSSCVGSVQKHAGVGLSAREAWKLQNSLQVQRMAYENMGLGRWNSLHAMVPTTSKGEKFGQPTRRMRDSMSSEWAMMTSPMSGRGSVSGYAPLTPSPYAYDGNVKSVATSNMRETDYFFDTTPLRGGGGGVREWT